METQASALESIHQIIHNEGESHLTRLQIENDKLKREIGSY